MNTSTQAQNTDSTDRAQAKAAPVAEDQDWLSGVTPQASCNLDGTCESCQ